MIKTFIGPQARHPWLGMLSRQSAKENYVPYVFQGYVGFIHSDDYFKTIKNDSSICNPVSELIVQNNLMTAHCMTVIQAPVI